MELLYNLIMGKTELFSIILLSVFIAICLASSVILVWRGGKGTKIVFCVFSALCLTLCITFAVIWTGVFSFDVMQRIVALKDSLAVPILTLALAIISAITLIVVAASIKRKAKQLPLQNEVPIIKEEVRLPDNYRRAGERKHGEYTIIKLE